MTDETTQTSGSTPSSADIEAALLRAELFAMKTWYLCRFQTLLPLIAEAESQSSDSEIRALIDGVLVEAIGDSVFMEEA